MCTKRHIRAVCQPVCQKISFLRTHPLFLTPPTVSPLEFCVYMLCICFYSQISYFVSTQVCTFSMTLFFLCVFLCQPLDINRLCVFLCQPLWILVGCYFYVSNIVLFFVHPHVMRRPSYSLLKFFKTRISFFTKLMVSRPCIC